MPSVRIRKRRFRRSEVKMGIPETESFFDVGKIDVDGARSEAYNDGRRIRYGTLRYREI